MESIVIEQYKALIEHADRVTVQRNQRSRYYLTINSAIVTGTAYLFVNVNLTYAVLLTVLMLVGVVLSFIWYKNTLQYMASLKAIWEQVQELEKNLPAKPHSLKWQSLVAQGYKNSSYYEKLVPQFFCLIYTVGVGSSLVFVFNFLNLLNIFGKWLVCP